MRFTQILRSAGKPGSKPKPQQTAIPYEVYPLVAVGVFVTGFAAYTLGANFMQPSTRKGRQGIDTSRYPSTGDDEEHGH